MGHRSFSAALNAVIDGTLSYHDLQPGEILHIRARDARRETGGVLRLQVVAVLPSGRDGLHDPVFQFLGDDFAVYNTANEPVVVPEGVLGQGGVSATLVPHIVLSMVAMNGIGLGRDWALDWVDGKHLQLKVHLITRIEREDPPLDWQLPAEALAVYLARVATAKEAEQVRRARREERLRRPMVVRTKSGSTYRLGPADTAGTRTLVREGSADEMRGMLIALHAGGSMVFRYEDGQDLTTSRVIEIDPSPDAEEAA